LLARLAGASTTVLMIKVVGSVLVGITLFLVLMVLRSLLRRTVLMRTELDEVV
jgi:hypothetical protein